MCVYVCVSERLGSYRRGRGGFIPELLIKKGRCIKLLQISAASPVESAPSSGCASKRIVFAVLICGICVSAGTKAFTWLAEEVGAGLWQITMGVGSGRDQTLSFSCNWEKGGSFGIPRGTAAPDSDIHFPFVFLSWPFEIFSGGPRLTVPALHIH